MKVMQSYLIFDIGKNETLAPMVHERGWTTPTAADPESTKDFDSARAVLKRHVFDGGDLVTFEIVGPTLTDISLAYAGIIVDLEDVGLLPKRH